MSDMYPRKQNQAGEALCHSWNHGAKKLYESKGLKEYAVSYDTYLE